MGSVEADIRRLEHRVDKLERLLGKKSPKKIGHKTWSDAIIDLHDRVD